MGSGHILLRELISRQFQLQATYAEEDFVTNKSMQSILSIPEGPRLKFLLGCINSAVCSWVFLHRSNIAHRDDFPKIVLKETRLLPIPNATGEQQLVVERLVNKLLAAKAQSGANSIAELDRKLDDFVADLFGLSESDRQIIFGSRT